MIKINLVQKMQGQKKETHASEALEVSVDVLLL
jgi:hypothetical protein